MVWKHTVDRECMVERHPWDLWAVWRRQRRSDYFLYRPTPRMLLEHRLIGGSLCLDLFQVPKSGRRTAWDHWNQIQLRKKSERGESRILNWDDIFGVKES